MDKMNLSMYSQVGKNILVFKEHYILYMTFFALGFGKYILYIPFLFLFYSIKLPSLQNIKVKKNYLVLFLLYFLFLVSLFGIGYDRMTLESPFKHFVVMLIAILVAGIAFQYQKHEVRLNLIGFYMFGLFLDNFIVAAYSFYTDPILYGYGRLLSPFTDEEMNSPGVSNMLAIALAYFYYMAVYNKDNFYIKLISIIVISLSLAAAVFLGGRTFFVIFAFIIATYFVSNLSVKSLLYFFANFLVLLLISIYVFSTNEYFQYYSELLLNRFDKGLESNRFAHYAHGMDMIFQYPFGGFGVDTGLESTKWFHNIFLDTARVAGWIPILFFLAALIYTAKSLLYKKRAREEIVVPFVIASVAFLVMQQDVVIEGGFRSLIVLFFASYCLIDSKFRKKGI